MWKPSRLQPLSDKNLVSGRREDGLRLLDTEIIFTILCRVRHVYDLVVLVHINSNLSKSPSLHHSSGLYFVSDELGVLHIKQSVFGNDRRHKHNTIAKSLS
jgi:hypothetical protein